MHVWNKDTKIGRKTKELKFYSFVSLPDILLFHMLRGTNTGAGKSA